jgi:hypothetical protein
MVGDPAKWRYRFDLIDQEMLASQVVAIMDAHWCRPDAAQKRDILRRAEQQIAASFNRPAPQDDAGESRDCESQSRRSSPEKR